MKFKKFLLPLLVTPLFLASCAAEKNVAISETEIPAHLASDEATILEYSDLEDNIWIVNTETHEIFKNGNLFLKYEVFSDTLWYRGHSLIHISENQILIENFYKEGSITVLTLVPPKEEPADETTGE